MRYLILPFLLSGCATLTGDDEAQRRAMFLLEERTRENNQLLHEIREDVTKIQMYVLTKGHTP